MSSQPDSKTFLSFWSYINDGEGRRSDIVGNSWCCRQQFNERTARQVTSSKLPPTKLSVTNITATFFARSTNLHMIYIGHDESGIIFEPFVQTNEFLWHVRYNFLLIWYLGQIQSVYFCFGNNHDDKQSFYNCISRWFHCISIMLKHQTILRYKSFVKFYGKSTFGDGIILMRTHWCRRSVSLKTE